MRIIISLVFALWSSFLAAQDYVIEEVFDTSKYAPKVRPVVDLNHRITYGYGLNLDYPKTNGTSIKGSNYFTIDYQYNTLLLKKLYLTSGFNYNWKSYRLNNDSAFLYSDSLFSEKRKIRAQNLGVTLGLRFQSKPNANSAFYMQVNMYGEALMHSAYITWDEIDGSPIKKKLAELPYLNHYNYGAEVKIGISYFLLFAKYRLGNFVNNNNYTDLPTLTLGFAIEVGFDE